MRYRHAPLLHLTARRTVEMVPTRQRMQGAGLSTGARQVTTVTIIFEQLTLSIPASFRRGYREIV